MTNHWVTKLIAAVVMAVGYVLHKGIIPPGYEIHIGSVGVSVAGVLTDLLVFLASVGISGPQLWPQLASMLGNGAAKPTPPADAK